MASGRRFWEQEHLSEARRGGFFEGFGSGAGELGIAECPHPLGGKTH